MNKALRNLTHRYMIIYLNDIVIYSDTAKDHFNYLKEIFRQLNKVELYAKLLKYTIEALELEFYDYVVGND